MLLNIVETYDEDGNLCRYIDSKTGKLVPKTEAKNYYHFHKDCAFFEHCRVEEVKERGHKYIVFHCPAFKERKDGVKYYKNDFHTIKWECDRFVPIQERLSLGS